MAGQQQHNMGGETNKATGRATRSRVDQYVSAPSSLVPYAEEKEGQLVEQPPDAATSIGECQFFKRATRVASCRGGKKSRCLCSVG